MKKKNHIKSVEPPEGEENLWVVSPWVALTTVLF